MRKRMCLATGAVVVMGCAILVVLALLPSRPGVTEANVYRIKQGMTESEVVAIFGKSADESVRIQNAGVITILKFDAPTKAWSGADGFAYVKFDADGKATEKNWAGSPQTLLQRIRHWIHL